MFGESTCHEKGYRNIRPPMGDNSLLWYELFVFDLNVPLLLGLYFPDAFNMTIDLSSDQLITHDGKCKIPLIRKSRHVSMEWDNLDKFLLITTELHNLHQNFYYQDSQRLY